MLTFLFFSAFDILVYENFTANLGEWATIEVATGARGSRPLVLVDSNGILWIMGGSPERTSTYHLTAVWNYNPKTDQYRYVWKSTDPSPFIARDKGETGVPSPTAHPGGLFYTAGAIDENNNIWLYSNQYGGELWMFNTKSWHFSRMFGLSGETSTFSEGSQPGLPGPDVWPGQTEGQCMVIDSRGLIWMLVGDNGGGSVSAGWYYNVTSSQWAFAVGSTSPNSTTHSADFYGGTWMGGCDIDSEDRIWLYGGWGSSSSGSSGDYGHLWSFDARNTLEYRFEYGANAFEVAPQVASDDYHPDNRPPAAEGCALIDRQDGTLMLVPGIFYSESQPYGASDTIWLYSKSLKQWKLVHGNITKFNIPRDFSNYRTPGSVFGGSAYFGYNTGKNSNGDLYLVGGGIEAFILGAVNYKDIWLIPQDQCTAGLFTCDANADCVEEIIGYSCKCKDGFSGDGSTCVAIPAAPVADVPVSEPIAAPSSNTPTLTPSAITPSNKASGASLLVVSATVIIAVVAVLGL